MIMSQSEPRGACHTRTAVVALTDRRTDRQPLSHRASSGGRLLRLLTTSTENRILALEIRKYF